MEEEEIPRLFKKWSYWYGLLIAALLVQVVLYYWLTTAFE
jgi:hypothetical protein